MRSLPVDYVANKLAAAVLGDSRRAYGSPVYAVIDVIARWFPRWIERTMVGSTARVLAGGQTNELTAG